MRTKLTKHSTISRVIADMTISEKISLLSAASACRTTTIPELGIPAIQIIDGVTGLNSTEMIIDYNTSHDLADRQLDWLKAMEVPVTPLEMSREKYHDDPLMLDFIDFVETMRPNGKSFICFPSGVNIGASWNLETAKAIGKAVGWEMRDSKVDVCLGPNVDVQRDPLGGRNYEMYGEDPCLVGKIGAAFIRGMQETGVGACAKHFMANNQETRRETKDTHVSERTLREIYSPGFICAVKEAKVKTVMSALNAINGVFSSYNKTILTDWLKEEWGFEGVVVSDWGAAAKDKDKALNAGLDLILPGPNDMSNCCKALKDGTLTEAELNAHVERVLKLICDLKAEQAAIPAEYDAAAILQTACDTIADGAVLLKNANAVLPLQDINRIAFWGRRSKSPIECGSGSTAVMTDLHSNVYEETVKLLGEEKAAFEQWENADALVYTAAAPGGEAADCESMDIEPEDRERMPAVLRKAKEQGIKTVVILNVSGPVEMRSWIEFADAVLCIFIPGCMGGKAAADLLLGNAIPAGRLPVTFPVRYEDTPSYPYFPGEHDDVYYGEGIFVGYRSYEKRALPVQFPFGFGLSCTQFEQSTEMDAVKFDLREQEEIRIPVQVKNIGSTLGSQVIQLYVEECSPRLLRPKKELKAFGKVKLAVGETAKLELVFKKEDLFCFDPKFAKWIIPVGKYHLYLGTSSADIFAEIPMTVYGDNPYVFGPDTTLGEVVKSLKAVEILNQFLPGLLAQLGDGIHLLGTRKLSDVLKMVIIGYIPDASKAGELLDDLYLALAQVD